jgi:AraC-like DNA-binding protein/quercetin dioxygenase-like cupin family protein
MIANTAKSRDRQVAVRVETGVAASLSYYSPSGRHSPHRHDFEQISFLLSGRMLERLEGRDFELDYCAVGIKPAQSLHQDDWGPDGAMIFSLKVAPGSNRLEGGSSPVWLRLRNPQMVGALVRCCMLAGTEAMRAEAADDLLAVAQESEPSSLGNVPAWLLAVRDQIAEAPGTLCIEGAARSAGIDRAHLSRMFRRFFGMPPSLYRQRCLAARAASRIADGKDSLSAIAADLGYADQSHLNRRFKSHTGLAPGQMRNLLRGADHIRPIPD